MKKLLTLCIFTTVAISTQAQVFYSHVDSSTSPSDTIAHRVGIESYFPQQEDQILHYKLVAGENAPQEFTMHYLGASVTYGGGFIIDSIEFKGISFPSGKSVSSEVILFEITPTYLRRLSPISVYDEYFIKLAMPAVTHWDKIAGYQKALHNYSYSQQELPGITIGDVTYKNVIQTKATENIDSTHAGGEMTSADYFVVFAPEVGIVQLQTKSGATYQLDRVEKLK